MRNWTRSRALLTTLLSLLACTLAAEGAHAAIFNVNDERDASDLVTNNLCDSSTDAGTQCTLRAAIEEANATTAADEVRFDGFVAGKTTSLDANRGAAGVPLRITQPLTIDGCRNATNPTGPCFGVRAPGQFVGFELSSAIVVAAPDVTITGLAMTNAGHGVLVQSGADRFGLRRSSLGVTPNGTLEGNSTGITINANDAAIGGASVGQGNVISANNIGVSVISGDRTRIAGNLIGTRPDGTTPAANLTGIQLRGSTGGDRPTGTAIGGPLTATEQASAVCDGPCNVVAGGQTSIDLGRNDVEGTAAVSTTIAGNHIGVDRTGNAAIAAFTGVAPGDAAQTTIGGGSAASRNLIAAASQAVLAERAPADLLIRENRLGTNAAGSARIASGAISAHSVPADPLEVRGNIVALGSSYGIQVRGSGVWIEGNYVGVGPNGADLGTSGESDGIRLAATGSIQTSDNTVQNNVIGNAGRSGLLIQGGVRNPVVSNRIGVAPDGSNQGNGAYGVLIDRAPANGPAATGNVIGTDDLSTANTISNNPKAAISIRPGNEPNYVNANRGNNPPPGPDGIEPEFIDLGDDGYGNAPTGPAGGLQAPTIVVAGTERVAGVGTPGAFVRIYEKETPGRGELAGMAPMTAATVATDGTWTAQIDGTLPPSRLLAATQTIVGPAGGTSELSDPGITRAAPFAEAPETTISGPEIGSDPRPELVLSASQDDTGFVCRLDGAALYTPCFGNYRPDAPLSEGEHVLDARAVNLSGQFDPTPATKRLTIDLTAPGAPSITGGPSAATSERRPAFTFTGDPDARFRCAFDGGAEVDCSSGHAPAQDLGDGRHTFSVVQLDRAGNRSEAATRSFTVERRGGGGGGAPETRFLKTPPKKLKSKRGRAKAKFAFDSSVPGSGFRCGLDGKPLKPCTSPLKLKVKRGKHRFTVVAVAPGGTADPSPAVHAFKVR